MHWIYLIHEFHNLSWITEINELFHDILIYWDAPVCMGKCKFKYRNTLPFYILHWHFAYYIANWILLHICFHTYQPITVCIFSKHADVIHSNEVNPALKVSAHWVRNFRTLKNKYDLMLCQSRLHTASETFVRQKKFGSGSIFCVFASVACILDRKGWRIRKTEKRMRKFRTPCAMAFTLSFSIPY